MPLITWGSLILPSLSMTKLTNTEPSIPILRACAGYFMFLARNFAIASNPPSNSACCSTIVNMTSSSLVSFKTSSTGSSKITTPSPSTVSAPVSFSLISSIVGIFSSSTICLSVTFGGKNFIMVFTGGGISSFGGGGVFLSIGGGGARSVYFTCFSPTSSTSVSDLKNSASVGNASINPTIRLAI